MKIICFVGKYKGNLFLCLRMNLRAILSRFDILSHFETITIDIRVKLSILKLPAPALSFINQQNYQNLNICVKKRKLFTSLFLQIVQVATAAQVTTLKRFFAGKSSRKFSMKS
jgi:hypothetical protein